MGEDKKNRFGEIIGKCWKDAAFKQRFLTDPKSVLAEFDIDVPSGVTVKVVESTNDTMFLTLPPDPRTDELSDKALDNVSGGAGNIAAARPPVAVSAVKNLQLHPQPAHTSGGNNVNTCGQSCIPW